VKNNQSILSFLMLAALCGSLWVSQVSAQDRASIFYVDIDQPGGTGDSWGTAFKYLQDALGAASDGDQIWVAEGVYYPDDGTDPTDNSRDESFFLKDGVALYGGFDGTEASLSERDRIAHITVLSGDIDQDDVVDSDGVVMDVDNINGANAYHVVQAEYVGSSSVLDGFIITAGDADTGSLCAGDDCGGGILNNDGSTPTLKNLYFIANYAVSNGGGMYINSGTGSELSDLGFLYNEAYFGAGLALKNTDLSLWGGYFEGNSAEKGGGIYSESDVSAETGDLNLIDVTFEYNQANIDTIVSAPQTCTGGGGLCFVGDENLFLDEVTFYRNTSKTLGGGLYLDSLGTALLRDADFEENTSDNNGAGLAAFNSTLTINDSNFEDNETIVDGGGVYFNSGTLVINDSDFSYNSARYGAGLMLSEGSASMDGGTFRRNTAAETGGGIYGGWDSSLDIGNMTFTENTAKSGGGIYSDVDQGMTLDQVTFTRNTASTGYGGGLCNESDSTLTNVVFHGNQANWGGGLSNVLTSISLENAVFVGNQSEFNGGGIYVGILDADSFSLVNATFADNGAGGGDALYSEITGSNPTAVNALISNSVFWNGEYQVNLYGEIPIIRNCNVEGGLFGVTGVMDQDPLFTRDPDPGIDGVWGTADDDYGDLRPASQSPVINAGWNADSTLLFDLDGSPRIVGWSVDLGAYEVQNINYPIFIPLLIR